MNERSKKQIRLFLVIVGAVGLLCALGLALAVMLDVRRPLEHPEAAAEGACTKPLREVFDAAAATSATLALLPEDQGQTPAIRARIRDLNTHYRTLVQAMAAYRREAQGRTPEQTSATLARMRTVARQFSDLSNIFYAPPFITERDRPARFAEASTRMYQLGVYLEYAWITELIRAERWSEAVGRCRAAAHLPESWPLEQYCLRRMGAAGSRQLYQRSMQRNLNKIGHALFGAGAKFFGEEK